MFGCGDKKESIIIIYYFIIIKNRLLPIKLQMDLNVKAKLSSDREMVLLAKKVAEFGWHSLAWNQVVLAKSAQRAQVKPKDPVVFNQNDLKDIENSRDMLSSSSEPGQEFTELRQFNRITIYVDDVADAQNITSSNEQLRKFDIVAAIPGNAQAFAHLCRNSDVDIISIDFSHKVPFPITKKIVSEVLL
jgi:hypothetical protein